MLNRVYLGLGSNLGDRRGNIASGLQLIKQLGKNFRASSLYETTPQGFADQPRFLNAACGMWTDLDPFRLLHKLKEIEAGLMSGRAFVNAPRTLDIDILIYGNLLMRSPALTLPHPRMAKREFVLRPLAEIAPDLVHPVFKRTTQELLKQLPNSEEVVIRAVY